MNAFIAAVLEKKTILVANEARLLKKSFLGIAILAMAFQGNNFGEMIRSTLVVRICKYLFLLVLHYLFL